MSHRQDYRELLDFWFSEAMKQRWFDSTPELDQSIRKRYEALWLLARDGELNSWKDTPDGVLALVIAFDQLPLNMFRGRPESFSTEQHAVAVARQAIEAGLDQLLPADLRMFLYMPFMHSENLADQDCAVDLFGAAGLPTQWAEHHREIVRRFGRFPHRNAILGRASTPDELGYLASPQAFKG